MQVEASMMGPPVACGLYLQSRAKHPKGIVQKGNINFPGDCYPTTLQRACLAVEVRGLVEPLLRG